MNSVTLLPTTGNQLNLTGQRQKGAGYSNFAGANHTVSISCSDFVGRIYIEASLETEPTESDWFPVMVQRNLPYVEYPQDPSHPTGVSQGDTSTTAYEFAGNYVWVRARLDRTYLTPVPIDPETVGSVDEVLMNYGALGNSSSVSNLSITGPRGPVGVAGATGAQGQPGPTGVTNALVNGAVSVTLNSNGSLTYPSVNSTQQSLLGTSTRIVGNPYPVFVSAQSVGTIYTASSQTVCVISAVIRAHTADVAEPVSEMAHVSAAQAPVFGVPTVAPNINVHGQCTSNDQIPYVNYTVELDGNNRMSVVADLSGLNDGRFFTYTVTEFDTTLLA